MSKFFYFQVVNVFLAITILGSVFGIVDQVQDLLSDPRKCPWVLPIINY
jgi:hypothetical protein